VQSETGGRFEARLVAEEPTQARFRVELSAAGAAWSSDASVSRANGDVSFYAWSGAGDPPAWLCRYLISALRSAWRAHAEQGWPRRLTRWRAEPEPGRDRADEST
jgi:hypothetical protein